MNLDLSTVLGVLGVLLTVVFFIIGYRQTIGARKERAASANKEIVDVLLRRLTLENDFAISREDIERFILGKALENRVKRADIYRLGDLWVLIYSRIVSSDHVSAKLRKTVLDKVAASFSPPAEEQAVPVLEERRAPSGDLPSEALLALISILLASVGLAFVTSFAAKSLADLTEPLKSLGLPFASGGGQCHHWHSAAAVH